MNVVLNKINAIDQLLEQAHLLDVMPSKLIAPTATKQELANVHYWHEPILADCDERVRVNTLNLAGGDNLLSDFSKSIALSFQFPVNTIFAHGLGVIASAMSKSFKFKYGQGEKPVNLYVVSAQPPSTGKSGVNELLSEPVHLAFEEISRSAMVKRKKIQIQIESVKKQKKEAKHEDEKFMLEDELTSLYQQQAKNIIYTYSADDPTPEGLAKLANNQNGIFNIISAEADAINVILGGVYSDKKANHGLFLKGWDAERITIVRSGQDTITFKAVGNIAVIAQDESIKTILEAGESGRGISERFLLVREPTLLGKRQFDNFNSIDQDISAEYARMIFNIVTDNNVVLVFNDESLRLINNYRKETEPEMSDIGRYSNNMMRGFIGKADKQIMKIASVLHTIENWRDKGVKSPYIDITTVKEAIHIFQNIADTYVSAADELGFTGIDSEYKKIEEKLIKYAENSKLTISINQLRSNIKDIKPFSGTPNLTSKIKDVLLPVLEENKICVTNGNKIHINPLLKG